MKKSLNAHSNLFPCLAGNVVEWFEFAIYGYLAPTIAMLFFPNDSPTVAHLQTFIVFAMGFLMRPLGSVFFGYLGDKYGRKLSLFVSITLISIPTGVIGLLPTYSSLGVVATYFLVICRVIQGFSAGGELTISMVFISEHAPNRLRGFYASLTQASAFFGVWFGAIAGMLVLNIVDEENILVWGWRIPFIIASLLGLVAIYFLAKTNETDVFSKIVSQPKKKEINFPVFTPILSIFFTTFSCAVSFYIIFVYLPSFLDLYANVTLSKSLILNSVNMFFMILMIPMFGILSDKLGRSTILLFGNAGLILFAYPLFGLLTSSNGTAVFAQFIFSIFIAAIFAPIPARISELSSNYNRCFSVSLGFNLSIAIFGGTAPLIAIKLISLTSDAVSPSYYIIFAGLVSFIAVAMGYGAKQNHLSTEEEVDFVLE